MSVSGAAPLAPDDGPFEGQSALLISPMEPEFWHIFSASAEYSDGAANPMDRWSKRILGAVAADTKTTAIFPSNGPPFSPFYTWALRSGAVWASPISFLVHKDTGLFTSFRGALLTDQKVGPETATKPCLTCDAPCLTACPVDAFATGYDVAACKTHLASDAGTDCMSAGCRARRACPVGAGKRLPAQAQFHMDAFL